MSSRRVTRRSCDSDNSSERDSDDDNYSSTSESSDGNISVRKKTQSHRGRMYSMPTLSKSTEKLSVRTNRHKSVGSAIVNKKHKSSPQTKNQTRNDYSLNFDDDDSDDIAESITDEYDSSHTSSHTSSQSTGSDSEYETQNRVLPKITEKKIPHGKKTDKNDKKIVSVNQHRRSPRPSDSNKIFRELIKNQIKDVPSKWKLTINDIKRICKYIDTSIFDATRCCIWNGYVTNANNSNKGVYVNFYFKNKKVALHRLLYSNFVSPLDSSEYLKFSCDNKGVCCNVNHYEKYKYSKSIKRESLAGRKMKKNQSKHSSSDSDSSDSDSSSDGLFIGFD